MPGKSFGPLYKKSMYGTHEQAAPGVIPGMPGPGENPFGGGQPLPPDLSNIMGGGIDQGGQMPGYLASSMRRKQMPGTASAALRARFNLPGGNEPVEPEIPGATTGPFPGRNYTEKPPIGRKSGWLYDPMTGKPIGGGLEDMPKVIPGAKPPTGAAGGDFWSQMRTILDDETDPMDDETWQYLVESYATDPKWKAPTSASSKRLLSLMTVMKKMGYDADTLGPMIEKALNMGYTQPRWNLSLFNSLLSGYGLGTQAP